MSSAPPEGVNAGRTESGDVRNQGDDPQNGPGPGDGPGPGPETSPGINPAVVEGQAASAPSGTAPPADVGAGAAGGAGPQVGAQEPGATTGLKEGMPTTVPGSREPVVAPSPPRTTAAEGAGTDPQATPGGIRGIVTGIQGMGEVFRGHVMQSVDEMFGHQEGAEKHKKIAEAGLEKVRAAKGGTGAGAGAGEEPTGTSTT